MQNFNSPDHLLTGTYEIRNLVNGKVYVGSTAESFKDRLNHHRSQLRKGCHKNTHLQRAWDKYGEQNFTFNILEIVDPCCTLDAEQLILDSTENKYNINPSATGTPNLSQETIEKRTATFTLTMQVAMEYYYKVKDQTIIIADVPEKYRKLVEDRLNRVVWNKGLTSEDVDYSYLKGVSKNLSDKFKQTHKDNSDRARDNFGGVHVYDLNLNYIRSFRSPKDIEEWSHTNENDLPIKSRFKSERMGIPIKVLQSVNIIKSCNHGKSYKGLYFRRDKLNLS